MRRLTGVFLAMIALGVLAEARQLIVCPTSKLAYPIKDGIPAMLPEDAIKLEDNDPLLTRS